MKCISAVCYVVFGLVVQSTPAFAAEPITGKWFTDNQQALVDIQPCGTSLCGTIVKVLRTKPGSRKTDAFNPDPAKRHNPMEGTVILSELVDAGDLWKGKIYNPESGKTYNAKIKRGADGSLKVEGCVAFICQGPTWQPAP
ncbi:DUF2147 domain-containing protein [Xanthomonas hortorum]|uniref:DUF2147 domain-containing protein n=1 Tax=Xanthomonas hortorum pv. pelargonii TaxID=453602 RepID=A0A6V7F2K1_9XANT|nr:DUF2147 domain-containing protein [Xanthomonas hortorum]MCE4352984.1 DUF2147 domain-containing protein [Xanthomonas hortorum pv. pelargonii]MCM5524590.1 DUF2147 domain-containing protein [Xanthomonas hortorum pv. pelargonii]MCM5537115.1 DUF2147 domain-containing protein [Xanthomonas hortorum pv. pelargonii]MCM5541227.1 DUF2147 domain-containing protein [Xanthomonas hortorum pv. pelargonii]MCM5545203.1 DUF2147 domain-containing protein [Xanthomonas hortorum pv. pelargonii]